MYAATDCTPHDPSGQDSLSPKIKQRIHRARRNPAALTAILRQCCPGLTPDMALAWLATEVTFEAAALEQAARLLGGEWEA